VAGKLWTLAEHCQDRSGCKPAVYDFFRAPRENAKNPGQVDNRGAFADFVHVQECSEQTLARAPNICKGVSGPGGSKAVLDLLRGPNLAVASGEKGPPRLAVG
jgi:hypothetical protein